MGNGMPFLSCKRDPPRNDNTKVTLGLTRIPVFLEGLFGGPQESYFQMRLFNLQLRSFCRESPNRALVIVL